MRHEKEIEIWENFNSFVSIINKQELAGAKLIGTYIWKNRNKVSELEEGLLPGGFGVENSVCVRIASSLSKP